MVKPVRSFVSRSVKEALATGGVMKRIPGFEAWFYTGPSKHFGHKPNPKKGKKK